MSATSFNPDVASSLSGLSSAAQSASSGADMASKEVFLQLLVAQIKNQNPLNPADGVEFMSQLAQFSQLEQLLSIGEDISSIRAALEAAATVPESPATVEP